MRAAIVAAVAMLGCTYDFEDYEPRGDAAFDTRTDTAVQDTLSLDSGCVPVGADSCYSASKTCGATCGSARATCEAGCGGNPSCRKTCRETETTCRSTCVSDCTTCTQNRGCATPVRCASEVG